MASAPTSSFQARRSFSAPTRSSPWSYFMNAALATAFFRCWRIILFFSAWGSLITVLNHQGHNLHIESILLTVVGTVLGFVISYTTTTSFERYNEGRHLWSQIISASRTFARTVWFHVPNYSSVEGQGEEEATTRSLIEKKSAINLVEAYAVAVKHYLRGEDGIYYQDLYDLVKFLPTYATPPAMRSLSTALKLNQESEASAVSHGQATRDNFPTIPLRGSMAYQSMTPPFSEEKGTAITVEQAGPVLHQMNTAENNYCTISNDSSVTGHGGP